MESNKLIAIVEQFLRKEISDGKDYTTIMNDYDAMAINLRMNHTSYYYGKKLIKSYLERKGVENSNISVEVEKTDKNLKEAIEKAIAETEIPEEKERLKRMLSELS